MRRWLSVFAVLVVSMLMAGAPVMGKQSVTVELFYSGVWNDHTADLDDEPIIINHAAGSEQSGVVPTDGTLRFKSPNGRMNPDNPKGPLYGLIGEKTPIRVKVSGDIRISGRAVKWSPRRSLGGSKYVSWVDVTIAGKVREMGQGQPPVVSAMTRALAVAPPLAWWTLETGLLASSANTGPGVVSASPVGPAVQDPLTRITDGVLGTSSLVDLSNGTRIDFPIPPHTLTPITGYVVEAMVRWQPAGFTGGLSVDAVRLIFEAGAGNYAERVNLETNTSSQAFLFLLGSVSGSGTATPTANVYDGATRHVRIEVFQSGADVAGIVTVNGVSSTLTSGSTSLTAATLTKLKTVSVNFVGESGTKIPAVGQIAVYNTLPFGPGADAYDGYLGESAEDRFLRMCGQLGITGTVVGSSGTQLMGPQYPDTDLKLFEEIAKTDGGIIHDTRSQLDGLTFRTGRSMHNQ